MTRLAGRIAILIVVIGAVLGAGAPQASAQLFLTQKLLDLVQSTTGAQQAPVSGPQSSPAPSGPGAKAASTHGPDKSVIDMTLSRVDQFRANLRKLIQRGPDVITEIIDTLELSSPTGEASFFARIIAYTVMLLLIGRGVALTVARFVFKPWFVGLQKPEPKGVLEKLPVLTYRVLLTMIAVIITCGVAAALSLAVYPEDEASKFTGVMFLVSYAGVQPVNMIWRMVLSPYLPNYRIPCLTDEEARSLYFWMRTATVLSIGSLAVCSWLLRLGLPADIHAIMTIISTLALVVLLLVLIIKNRRAVNKAILGGEPASQSTWLAAGAAAVWAPLVAAYLIFAWAQMFYRLVVGVDVGVPVIVGAYIVLTVAVVVYGFVVYAIERAFQSAHRAAEDDRAADQALIGNAAATEPPFVSGDDFGADGDADGDGDEEGGGPMISPLPPGRARLGSFEDLAHRVASLLAIGAGVYALIFIWGGDEMLADGRPLAKLQSIINITFIGYIVYQFIRIWMDRKICEEGGEITTEPGEEGGGSVAASRLATLLPLTRNFVLAVVAVSVLLVVLLELGVNVAPLFAGAGVVGIAIGFGAQTLIRDIISGAFFLIDDAFRKGEYIDIGEVKGTVEKISVRSFQLRHHLGALNTVPFGEVRYLTNYSRDWVLMKLPLRLTYDTDVEKVRKLIKKLGQDLLKDPDVGHNFIQSLKSQGVYKMEDSAMIIRVKFMTKPGDQWVARKKIYSKIRELFERDGIKFAHREVTVRLNDSDSGHRLTDEEKKAVAAAARSAVDDADAKK